MTHDQIRKVFMKVEDIFETKNPDFVAIKLVLDNGKAIVFDIRLCSGISLNCTDLIIPQQGVKHRFSVKSLKDIVILG